MLQASQVGTSAAVTASALVTSISSPSPPWFIVMLKMLHSEEMGREWTELVHSWEKFEDQHSFVKVGRLGSMNRLQCIADWIQRAGPVSCLSPHNQPCLILFRFCQLVVESSAGMESEKWCCFSKGHGQS